MKYQTGGSLVDRLFRFLFKYRAIPHSTPGVSQAELLMDRQLKSRLDLFHPSVTQSVKNQQMRLRKAHWIELRTFYRNYVGTQTSNCENWPSLFFKCKVSSMASFDDIKSSYGRALPGPQPMMLLQSPHNRKQHRASSVTTCCSHSSQINRVRKLTIRFQS
ncbi:retrotransposon-like protein 1 [Plakobranchus ocellatus]|uniref:Retrotransposon-like protein 1 n=1 Tax=Plakobranchus ocellatus TaxID=259542 RepID=A0AAV4CC44_9GAST|nr:retrotransposon-like protein 1 [Plakobranchus ocellatus]